MRRAAGRGAQAVRQLRLLRYLATANTWCNYRELSEHLGTGYRTIYRDVEQLIRMGVPIDHDDREARGWRLRKGALIRWLTTADP